jgi:branched-chain amino acid transport system substrate-binding protein
MKAYKQFPGMEGAPTTTSAFPKNPVNDWLVASHYKQFKAPPDFFTAGGLSAGRHRRGHRAEEDQWRRQRPRS